MALWGIRRCPMQGWMGYARANAAGFHTSPARHWSPALKLVKPIYPVKLVDGLPWYVAKAKEDVAKMQQARETVQRIKDVPVIHYKRPNCQAFVYSLQEKEATGIVNLNDDIWNQEIRKDIVHRVVTYHRARQRQGTHKQKGRSEVRGGGIKPRPQKGSGKARIGSIRSPLMRGGGAVLPRRPRDYSIKLQAKILSKSLQICLTAKFQEGNLFVIEDTDMPTHKTSALIEILEKKWGLYDEDKDQWQRLAVITGANELDSNLALAARNLKSVDFFPYYAANTWDVLRRECVFITREGLTELETRLQHPFQHKKAYAKLMQTFVPDPKLSHGLPDVIPALSRVEIQHELKTKQRAMQQARQDIARPWLYRVRPEGSFHPYEAKGYQDGDAQYSRAHGTFDEEKYNRKKFVRANRVVFRGRKR